jgi:solute carrier family 45 protein 1/2/4
LASSIIFKIVDGAEVGDAENTYLGKTGVAWVLRFGGLCALFGALFARMVPPTPTERVMRRRLAEIRLLRESSLLP